jgi:hypothetical protein
LSETAPAPFPTYCRERRAVVAEWSVPVVDPWLAQCPPQAQPLIRAWSTGWGSRQTCSLPLLALRHHRPQALACAQTLLEARRGKEAATLILNMVLFEAISGRLSGSRY